MNLVMRLREKLYEPRVRNADVDSAVFLQLHGQILREKPMLNGAFRSFYHQMAQLCDKFLPVEGREIELGSGAGFFKEVRPVLETSDIRKSPEIDLVLDAHNMDLEDASVRCIYAINVFHHLPEPELFFSELKRVLVPGGGCILIEPHGGPASAALHKRLHKTEFFDAEAADWTNSEIQGPLSGANQALSHIVFSRDLQRFKRDHGRELELIHKEYCTNSIRYLVSGGLNFRQLLPSAFVPMLRGTEIILAPASRIWSLHQALVLRRT